MRLNPLQMTVSRSSKYVGGGCHVGTVWAAIGVGASVTVTVARGILIHGVLAALVAS